MLVNPWVPGSLKLPVALLTYLIQSRSISRSEILSGHVRDQRWDAILYALNNTCFDITLSQHKKCSVEKAVARLCVSEQLHCSVRHSVPISHGVEGLTARDLWVKGSERLHQSANIQTHSELLQRMKRL